MLEIATTKARRMRDSCDGHDLMRLANNPLILLVSGVSLGTCFDEMYSEK